MLHGTLTLVTKIRPSRLEALEELLREVDRRIRQGEPHPFEGMAGLYFARWGILPPTPDGQRHLVFGADFSAEDGRYARRLDEFLERLVGMLAERRQEVEARAFDAIYRSCEGYPAKGLRKPTRVREFLRKSAVHYTARHVDFVYRVEPAAGMRRLLSLSEEVERYLSTHRRRLERLAAASPHWDIELHHELTRHLEALQPSPGWQRRWSVARRDAARATLLYPPLRYLVSFPLVGLFSALQRISQGVRGLARRKSSGSTRRPEGHGGMGSPRLGREPQGPVQNPMIHIATLKPGWGRWLALRMTLRSVNVRLARYVVGLNHIRSIHCARWVILTHPRHALFRRKTRRLLFFSNYDGSWESYIDSFIDDDDVRKFLVQIWSGTEDFPRRTPGRPFVEPFKAWIRQKQVPARVWYSAHLHGRAGRVEPSVTDLHHMLRLRRLLARGELQGSAAREDWRSFLSRGVLPPEPHLMRPREWARHLLQWRKDHVPTRTITGPRAPASPPAAAPVPPEARATGARAAPGRHPGAAAPWLQAHGRDLLPAAEDRGRLPLQELAAGETP